MDGDGAASLFSYGLERLILGCTTLVIFNSVYCFRGGSLTLRRPVSVCLHCVCWRVRLRPLYVSARDTHTHVSQTAVPFWSPSAAVGPRLTSGFCAWRSAPRRLDDRRDGRNEALIKSDQTAAAAASSEERPRAPHQGTPPPLILAWSRG